MMEGQIIRCGYLEVREENEAKKLKPSVRILWEPHRVWLC